MKLRVGSRVRAVAQIGMEEVKFRVALKKEQICDAIAETLLKKLTFDTHGVAVTEELERSAIETELTELIDKAAQVTLLRGGFTTQARRKRSDLKGFVRSPKLYLRLHPLFIARARIAVSFVGSRRHRPWRN